MKLFVCTSCHLGRNGFAQSLRQAMPDSVEVVEIECMSGCVRDQTVAFRAPGKTAYLFGDITESDIADLQNFAQHYAASPDGSFADARILGELRGKAVARIPA
jgi:predicted metal-binding protein